MSVMRLGYLHIRVTNLADAKRFYVDTLGMQVVLEQGNKIYLKCWDEWDHHSLMIEEGGVGVIKLGYKVAKPEDLAYFEKRIEAFGVSTTRMSVGETLGVGEGLRFIIPSGHTLELYHHMEFTDTAVGLINPPLFPRNLAGVGVPRLDHCLLKTDNIPLAERFFIEALDFKPAERLVSDLSSDGELLGTWLFCQHKTHDIAFVAGEKGRIHHWGYKLEGWDAIRHAGSILSMDDVSVGYGPEIHGLSRGETIYFFDPAGNRMEVFAGGYETYPDFPTITWTADQLPRAVGYISRELKENHFTVDT
ncbi:catechol 2,3-dioxygenase [Azotobacter beijerinckii]|uniref:Catechol 2,3-dioxygenase n=1 Tax=Azotobacter beijerinckii TaxID=170623 RepID=A0A1H6X8J6_9GAMM|nr:catechol 2,3-dioxygenase [Azotobacter beijerinckii]SEJ16439.1 catechol 2,3-dioxygenase [Azotobacter beijerinckii]SEJ21182.1 catechol 2,3-dioxygenase [Azotobacter beijerinckii]